MNDSQPYFRALHERAKLAHWAADDALYEHERPFYRYCTTGFPMIFADRRWHAQWEEKRRALDREWQRTRRIKENLKTRLGG